MNYPKCEYRQGGSECGFPAEIYDDKYRMTVCTRHAAGRRCHEGTEGQYRLTPWTAERIAAQAREQAEKFRREQQERTA